MKTGKSRKNKGLRTSVDLLLIFFFLMIPVCATAAAPDVNTKLLENAILTSLAQTGLCKKMEVQIRPSPDKQGEIKILAVKLEGALLGSLPVDYMTIVYEKPSIDINQLKNSKKLKILSASKMKVSILISAKAFEEYLSAQARQFQNKNYRISIKLSPPYLECFFNFPASGLSEKSLTLLNEFEREAKLIQLKSLIKSKKFEGYAAFQMQAKNNALYALPAKVIVNHFVIPDAILQELQNRFNPFDRIPVLSPFQYTISKVSVQNNYLFFSN